MTEAGVEGYKFRIFENDAIYYPTDHILEVISEANFCHQFRNSAEIMEIARRMRFLKNTEDETSSAHGRPDARSKKVNASVIEKNLETLGIKFDLDQVSDKDEVARANLSDYYDTLNIIYVEEELRDQNYYFMDRLLKSVLNNEIELWKDDLTRVMALPIENRDYKLNKQVVTNEMLPASVFLQQAEEYNASILDGSFVQAYRNKPPNKSVYSPLHRTGRYRRQFVDFELWLRHTNIHKSDLIKFCNSQRIGFEVNSDQSPSNNASEGVQVIRAKNTPKPEGTIPFPGKMPRIAIRKLSIDIAWDIERRTGKIPMPAEVMKVLQQWAEEGKHSDVLYKKTRGGVEWCTRDGYKEYDIAACGQALRTWKKSRGFHAD